MKDKKLREKVDWLSVELKDLYGKYNLLRSCLLSTLHDMEVRYCMQCCHETVQKVGKEEFENNILGKSYDYLCLTCGTPLKCTDISLSTEVKRE